MMSLTPYLKIGLKVMGGDSNKLSTNFNSRFLLREEGDSIPNFFTN